MGQRLVITLVALALAALWAGPAGAQEAYPPPENEEVLGQVEERNSATEGGSATERDPAAEEADDVEVEGVALESERGGLPMTGATVVVLAAVGLGALALGGTVLVVGRRRVHAR